MIVIMLAVMIVVMMSMELIKKAGDNNAAADVQDDVDVDAAAAADVDDTGLVFTVHCCSSGWTAAGPDHPIKTKYHFMYCI